MSMVLIHYNRYEEGMSNIDHVVAADDNFLPENFPDKMFLFRILPKSIFHLLLIPRPKMSDHENFPITLYNETTGCQFFVVLFP